MIRVLRTVIAFLVFVPLCLAVMLVTGQVRFWLGGGRACEDLAPGDPGVDDDPGVDVD